MKTFGDVIVATGNLLPESWSGVSQDIEHYKDNKLPYYKKLQLEREVTKQCNKSCSGRVEWKYNCLKCCEECLFHELSSPVLQI
ncbi:unnamed protein product [Caretta caretta]